LYCKVKKEDCLSTPIFLEIYSNQSEINKLETTNLCIVIPCYNEEEVLEFTAKELIKLLHTQIEYKKIDKNSSILFVDDGSNDGTWKVIETLASQTKHVKGIKLSSNRGHQNALLCGLLNTTGDIVISIDADLQDDLTTIGIMIDEFNNGNDIVYGVRTCRASDTVLKRLTAEIYYKLLRLMGVDIIFNHADFRLLSRKAISALKSYEETNLFLRGLIPSLGFSSSIVTYSRKKRFAGESKYPFSKMIALGLNGITSYSSVPLRLIAILGLLIFMFTIIISCWVLWVKFVNGTAIPGWASSVLPIYLLGGIQLFSIGIVGEYVGKIYMETKKRPRYIIEKRSNNINVQWHQFTI